MNKGDKIICINDIYHYATGELRFKKGKQYTIIDIASNMIGVREYHIIPEDEVKTCTMSLSKDSNFYSPNFLSLAQWRDTQIDSILGEQEIDGGNILDDGN